MINSSNGDEIIILLRKKIVKVSIKTENIFCLDLREKQPRRARAPCIPAAISPTMATTVIAFLSRCVFHLSHSSLVHKDLDGGGSHGHSHTQFQPSL